MINFMPFTYLGEPLIERLHALFGPVSVCLPLTSLATGAMEKAAAEGRMLLHSPEHLDQDQLRQSLNAFTAWADLHQGHTGELVGYFKSGQLQGIHENEADARRISTQIRQRADGVPAQPDNPLFGAALFLSLAHTYDQQQDGLNQDLGKVDAQGENLGRILGEPEEPQTAMEMGFSALTDTEEQDRGAYMTRRRLASWARTAVCCAEVGGGFVTTSGAVMEEILEKWPEARPVTRIALEALNRSVIRGETPVAEYLQERILALAQAENPVAMAFDNLFKAVSIRETASSLLLYVIEGCCPRTFISRFLDKKQMDLVPPPDPCTQRNTVIGLIAL